MRFSTKVIATAAAVAALTSLAGVPARADDMDMHRHEMHRMMRHDMMRHEMHRDMHRHMMHRMMRHEMHRDIDHD